MNLLNTNFTSFSELEPSGILAILQSISSSVCKWLFKYISSGHSVKFSPKINCSPVPKIFKEIVPVFNTNGVNNRIIRKK